MIVPAAILYVPPFKTGSLSNSNVVTPVLDNPSSPITSVMGPLEPELLKRHH